ncbi:hypothetical protein [Streptomyces sp. NPDC058108]|uniref:hypothetical protein n=1 Tax=Streptomyces sp. NPDC058108 TaxID=3346344 RepID=UPI0036E927D9
MTETAADALRRAAIGIEMKEAREADGRPLDAVELAGFQQDQAAARRHGFTDADIRARYDQLSGR